MARSIPMFVIDRDSVFLVLRFIDTKRDRASVSEINHRMVSSLSPAVTRSKRVHRDARNCLAGKAALNPTFSRSSMMLQERRHSPALISGLNLRRHYLGDRMAIWQHRFRKKGLFQSRDSSVYRFESRLDCEEQRAPPRADFLLGHFLAERQHKAKMATLQAENENRRVQIGPAIELIGATPPHQIFDLLARPIGRDFGPFSVRHIDRPLF